MKLVLVLLLVVFDLSTVIPHIAMLLSIKCFLVLVVTRIIIRYKKFGLKNILSLAISKLVNNCNFNKSNFVICK